VHACRNVAQFSGCGNAHSVPRPSAAPLLLRHLFLV
jgi:hypothetical protein